MPGPDEKEDKQGANVAPEKPQEVILKCPSEKEILCPKDTEFTGSNSGPFIPFFGGSLEGLKSTLLRDAVMDVADKISLAVDKVVYRCPSECSEGGNKKCELVIAIKDGGNVTVVEPTEKNPTMEVTVKVTGGVKIVCHCYSEEK